MLESRSWDGYKRLSRSVLDQVANDDPEALAQLVEHLAWVQAQLPDVVAKMRAGQGNADTGAGGYSWADIAQALGTTRQAAAQRFSVKG